LAERYPDNLTVIRYHTWWPYEYDPFYQYNIPENTARTDYYTIWYVMDIMIDGLIESESWEIEDSAIVDSILASRMSSESPLEIQISGTYASNFRWVELSIMVTATDTIALDSLRMQFVVTESGIYWPGPNGINYHNQTMRDMIPSADGEPFSIGLGDTMTFTRQFALGNALNSDSCQFVAFVQSHNQYEVLQSAKINLLELTPVGAIEPEHKPESFVLSNPYPNPFNSGTAIEFDLPEAAQVNLLIYDIMGREVCTLMDKYMQAGRYSVVWDGRNESNDEISTGVYFARLQAGRTSSTKKMILLK